MVKLRVSEKNSGVSLEKNARKNQVETLLRKHKEELKILEKKQSGSSSENRFKKRSQESLLKFHHDKIQALTLELESLKEQLLKINSEIESTITVQSIKNVLKQIQPKLSESTGDPGALNNYSPSSESLSPCPPLISEEILEVSEVSSISKGMQPHEFEYYPQKILECLNSGSPVGLFFTQDNIQHILCASPSFQVFQNIVGKLSQKNFEMQNTPVDGWFINFMVKLRVSEKNSGESLEKNARKNQVETLLRKHEERLTNLEKKSSSENSFKKRGQESLLKCHHEKIEALTLELKSLKEQLLKINSEIESTITVQSIQNVLKQIQPKLPESTVDQGALNNDSSSSAFFSPYPPPIPEEKLEASRVSSVSKN